MASATKKERDISTPGSISAVDRLVLATVNAPFERDISAATLQ